MVRTYIGLGSNLKQPKNQLIAALSALAVLPDICLAKTSSFYRSAPLGSTNQPDYINAVAELQTSLLPLELLHALQAIEQQQGRVRLAHWGPRTLDLDLLLYGDEFIDTAELTVPHPEMLKRNFVLTPLAEIAPELRMPDGRVLSDVVEHLSQAGLLRLANEVYE